MNLESTMTDRQPIDPQRTFVWERKVACRTLEGTAFILLGSRMVSLNGTGSRIWALLESGSTVEAVAEQIAEEFDVSLDEARTDTTEFVEALVARGLLVEKN